MIPAFEPNGNLPSGIHETTFAEFEKRFAYSIRRRNLLEGLVKLMFDLKKINCKSIYVDGSFVTIKRLPSDIDVCWEDNGIDYNFSELMLPILFDFDNGRRNQQNEYSCDIFPANFMESGSQKLFKDFFQQDKSTGLKKGIIKLPIL